MKTRLAADIYDTARRTLAREHAAGPRRQRTLLRNALVPIIRRNTRLSEQNVYAVVQDALDRTMVSEIAAISDRARVMTDAIVETIARGGVLNPT